MLQVFYLFWTYVASVSSKCCRSRSGVTHVVMRVRSGEGTSGPRTRDDMGHVWARKTRSGHGVQAQPQKMECNTDVRALTLSLFFLYKC
jgi:hypothetical protein